MTVEYRRMCFGNEREVASVQVGIPASNGVRESREGRDGDRVPLRLSHKGDAESYLR